MSDMSARVTASERAFHVEGYERIAYDLLYVDGVFELANTELADCYRDYGRALMVIDETVYRLYRQRIDDYFAHHGITLSGNACLDKYLADYLSDGTVPRGGGEADAVCQKVPDPTPLSTKAAPKSAGGSELHGLLGFRG